MAGPSQEKVVMVCSCDWEGPRHPAESALAGVFSRRHTSQEVRR